MATREFEAAHIHYRCAKALEGLEKHLTLKWREQCEENYKGHVEYLEARNNRWSVRFFNRKREEIMPFEEYVEWRKTWYDGWSFDNWADHKQRPYVQDRNDLRRIRNLSAENEKAGRLMTLSDTDYRDIVHYEKFA